MFGWTVPLNHPKCLVLVVHTQKKLYLKASTDVAIVSWPHQENCSLLNMREGFLSYDHEVPHILKPPPCFTPLFPGSTNELAHLESCLCPAFTCLYDGEKTNSRCGKPLDSYLRKCKVMLILDLCQKSRVIQESDTITLLLSSTPLTCLLLSLALQVVVQK